MPDERGWHVRVGASALAISFVVSACAGPEAPPTAAGNQAPPASTQTDEADEAATTSDGKLDFGAIEGTWSGTLETVIFGQNAAGAEAVEMRVAGSADRSSQVGQMDWYTAAGELTCTVTLSAIDATPPRYEIRERVPADQSDECAARKITLVHDAASDLLEFKGRWRDVTFEGVLNRGSE